MSSSRVIKHVHSDSRIPTRPLRRRVHTLRLTEYGGAAPARTRDSPFCADDATPPAVVALNMDILCIRTADRAATWEMKGLGLRGVGGKRNTGWGKVFATSFENRWRKEAIRREIYLHTNFHISEIYIFLD